MESIDAKMYANLDIGVDRRSIIPGILDSLREKRSWFCASITEGSSATIYDPEYLAFLYVDLDSVDFEHLYTFVQKHLIEGTNETLAKNYWEIMIPAGVFILPYDEYRNRVKTHGDMLEVTKDMLHLDTTYYTMKE